MLLIQLLYSTASPAQNGDTTITLSKAEYRLINTLRLFESMYIEKLDEEKLADMAILGISDHLDPHTQYFGHQYCEERPQVPPTGLGIKCRSYNDTLTAVLVDPEGPAYRAGIRPGQRLAYIGAIKVAGKVMSPADIRKTLANISADSILISYYPSRNASSPKNTTSAVDTTNNGGVNAHYAPNDSTLYIRITFFNKYTAPTFLKVIKGYSKKKRKNIILDLRNNPGGMWGASTEICNHFFGNNYMLTKATGDNYRDTTIFSNGEGMLKDSRLCILINENTGSASEVIAGCIQDWDRGVIIGRRSYGKGLIQQIMRLDGGEKLAITKARLETPAGRCVQRQYRQYTREDYMSEPMSRKFSGENLNESDLRTSIEDAKLKETCNSHRKVPCGVGIVPDIFVPEDTTTIPDFWNKWVKSGLVEDYCYHYVNINRERMKKAKTDLAMILSGTFERELADGIDEYSRKDNRRGNAPANLRDYIGSLPPHQAGLIRTQLYAGLAKAWTGATDAVKVLNGRDADFQRALGIINQPGEYYRTIR